MAKVSAIAKNERREKMISKYAEKRAKLKAVVSSKESSDQEKFEAQIKLAKLPRNSSKIRHRNRCNVTGRPRGFYRDFGISRIALREYGGWGSIPGLTKSSW
ncbi:MAG: 30S ribosomal protein S14 [Rickettsiales bacterium]|jgi:small subunit ribosomal protein S14